ncbi:hypothetical protein RLIN73S_02020 [Rhodanobacter lindaniclasticus]
MNTRRSSAASSAAPSALLGDIRALIEAARKRAASTVNSELTMLYWRIGQRIHTQVLDGRRGAYGKEVLPTLAAQLVKEYGNSFAEQNLRRMVQFAATFPDEQILVSLIRELSWTHFIALIPLKDPLQRDYYAQMASVERWSVRTLRERIDSMLYERTALSQKPEETIAQELAKMRDAQRMSPALATARPREHPRLPAGCRRTLGRQSDLEAGDQSATWSPVLLELGAAATPASTRQKRIPIDDEERHRERLDRPIDEQRDADAAPMLSDLAERTEVHLEQHGDHHDPDQQAHRQIDLGHFHAADGLEHAGRKLAQGDARDDAQQHPYGQVTLEDAHGGRRRRAAGGIGSCGHRAGLTGGQCRSARAARTWHRDFSGAATGTARCAGAA